MIILGFIVDSDAPFFHLSTRFYQKRYWRNNCFTLNWINIRIHNRFTVFFVLVEFSLLDVWWHKITFLWKFSIEVGRFCPLIPLSRKGIFVPRLTESWTSPGSNRKIQYKIKEPWCGLVIWWEYEFDYFYYLKCVIM